VEWGGQTDAAGVGVAQHRNTGKFRLVRGDLRGRHVQRGAPSRSGRARAARADIIEGLGPDIGGYEREASRSSHWRRQGRRRQDHRHPYGAGLSDRQEHADAGLRRGASARHPEVGFFDMVKAGEFNFGLLHVVGPSVSSLDEISEVLPLAEDKTYFVVKNFINETSFFEWNPDVYKSYFKMLKNAVEVNVPKLNEMAYEQVELAGVPFSTFVANRNPQGLPGNYSLVLRGYVRTWLNQISAEYDRVGLVDRLSNG
jgi:hypothetical protein